MADFFRQDPDEVLDYLFDFSDRLAADGGDTLSGATVTVEDGLTKNSEAVSSTGVTVWVSGGNVGETYTVEVDANTVGGRTYSRTIRIRIEHK